MRLIRFVDQLSGGLEIVGRFRMCSAHQSVVRSVSEFCGSASPSLEQVFSKEFLHRYEEYLTLLGRKRNTISFYMTVLRAIYSAAVQSKRLPWCADLFDEVFTGNDPTEKRAVGSDVLALLHCADLSSVPHLEHCRDLFMLSFHLQGMSFVDMAYLRKSDIQGSLVTYRRHKTGGLVRVSMLEPAREILDKYAGLVSDSPYVLPIVSDSGMGGYLQYQNALRNHNRRLKSLAAYLNIKENLTSYVARHSWATVAYHSGVNVSLVSQGMGHHTEEVTRIYLSSFEQERLAEVNRIVLDAILRPIKEGRVQIETGLISNAQNEPASNSIETQHMAGRDYPGINGNDNLMVEGVQISKNVRHYTSERHRLCKDR